MFTVIMGALFVFLAVLFLLGDKTRWKEGGL